MSKDNKIMLSVVALLSLHFPAHHFGLCLRSLGAFSGRPCGATLKKTIDKYAIICYNRLLIKKEKANDRS